MVSRRTVYLTIHKEKAERMIDSSIQKLSVYSKNEDKIKFGDNSRGTSTSSNWRVSLSDYQFIGKKVETPNGEMETGVLGTKMKYRSDLTYSKRAKEVVSQYIETG